MSDLTTEHRGYTIRYTESADEWRCFDLDVDAPTLTKAKEKINALLLKHRKAAALDVLIVSARHRSLSIIEGKAMDHKTRRQTRRNPETGRYDPFREHQIGVMAQYRGNKRPSKDFVTLDDLALPTPEVYAAIEKCRDSERRLKAAQQDYDACLKAIPRLTEEDIAGLIASCRPDTEDQT